jgi:hypothetical protein
MPARVVSFFMGIWFLSISMAHNLAGQIAKLTGDSSKFQVKAEIRQNLMEGEKEVLAPPSLEELSSLNSVVDAQLDTLGVKIETKNQFVVDLDQTYSEDNIELMVGKLNTKLSDLVTAFRPGEGELTPQLLQQLDRNVDTTLEGLQPTLQQLQEAGVLDLSKIVEVSVEPGASAQDLQTAAEGIRANVELLVQGSLSGYTEVWTYCSYGAIGAGVLLFIVAPTLNKLTHGVE